MFERGVVEFSSPSSGIELGRRSCLVIFMRAWAGTTICTPLPIDDGLLLAVMLDILLELDARR